MEKRVNDGEEYTVAIPVDDVAWRNEIYMAHGQQVCVGYDGIVRPFTIPLSVRQGWARQGAKNPYTNRVEVELLQLPNGEAYERMPAARRKRWWRRMVGRLLPAMERQQR